MLKVYGASVRKTYRRHDGSLTALRNCNPRCHGRHLSGRNTSGRKKAHVVPSHRTKCTNRSFTVETETQQQRCPLCATPAEYRWVDPKNTKHFYCTHCGQFQISVDAQKHLEKGPTIRKIALSKMAREHPYGYTLVIARQEDKELVSLSHKYVKNTELLK